MVPGRRRITKLEAARRELATAIRLYFEDGDIVSIHTLAAASHQVIHDVNTQRGKVTMLFDSEVIKDEFRAKAVGLLRQDSNFLKHADRDPDGILDLAPEKSESLVVFSLLGLGSLDIPLSDLESAFLAWFSLRHPEFLTAEGRKHFHIADTEEIRADLIASGRQAFLQLFSASLQRQRTPRNPQ